MNYKNHQHLIIKAILSFKNQSSISNTLNAQYLLFNMTQTQFYKCRIQQKHKTLPSQSLYSSIGKQI